MSESIELAVSFSSTKFATDSDTWRTQTGEMISELTRGGLSVRKEQSVSPGSRGGIAEVILALGSAGAFSAAMTMFKVWVKRDQTRAVEFRYHAKDRKGSDVVLTLKADQMSDDALKALLEKFER